MKFKWSDLPVYKLDSGFYSVASSFNTTSEKKARAAFARLYAMMVYYAPKYGVTFLLGLSNTTGKTACKTSVKRRGNPKIKVKGRKIPYHAHAIIAGEKAELFAREIVKRRNKADGKKLTKSKKVQCYGSPDELEVYDDKGVPFIDYIYEQSVATQVYPKDGFDFSRFKGAFFRIAQD